MFTGVQHLFHDIGILFSFAFNNIQAIFSFIISPFTAFAEMARGFFGSATGAPDPEILGFTSRHFEVLEALPFWNVLTGLIGGAIILLLVFGIIKTAQSL